MAQTSKMAKGEKCLGYKTIQKYFLRTHSGSERHQQHDLLAVVSVTVEPSFPFIPRMSPLGNNQLGNGRLKATFNHTKRVIPKTNPMQNYTQKIIGFIKTWFTNKP